MTDIDILWALSRKVPGKDINLYRKDSYGNIMYRPSYGANTPMGFEVDHIIPLARGGADTLYNKQLLNTRINRSKGASLVKKSRHSACNRASHVILLTYSYAQ